MKNKPKVKTLWHPIKKKMQRAVLQKSGKYKFSDNVTVEG